MIEREIRTPNLKLLLCKVISTESGNTVLEFKNGKRSEQISVEEFISQINDITQECTS